MIARVIGLDIGDRRIGVAMSDELGILASPLTVIDRADDVVTVEAIRQIIERNRVKLLVAGLPLSLSGKIGEQAEKVQSFVDQLVQYINIPVELRDERFSTVAALRRLRDARPKKTKQKVADDAIAAAMILQSYLEEGRLD